MSLFVIFKVILVTAIISFSTCNEDVLKNSTHLTNFRKLVEETSAENSSDKENSDSNKRFVSFIVQNAKKLFANSDPTVILDPDNDETAVVLLPNITTTTTTTTILNTENSTYSESMASTFSVVVNPSDKNSGSTLPDNYRKNETDHSLHSTDLSYDLSSTPTILSSTTHTTEVITTDKLLILEQKSIVETNRQDQSVDASKTSLDNDFTKRSCIACDNIAMKDCYDPKNKLISSRVCDHEEDLCYSMHTPFGIVDRGCFNVNNNLSTYVCSCNLCNYISISEMPYIFTEKQDWVENVKELSRMKRLRKSILKDMSCLRCEINAYQHTAPIHENADCLEGNINKLPIQECGSNEICGVMAIKSESYIWRGCLSKPLYNYWIALCDTDLCNYDSLVSLYDEEF